MRHSAGAKRTTSYLQAILLGLLMLQAAPLHATNLKEILESKSMERIDRENRTLDQMVKPNKKRPVSPWINTNTNYGKILTNKFKPDTVLHWLFGAVRFYKPLKPKFLKDTETVSYFTPIAKDKVRRAMDFKMLIPHPKFAESVKYGLVKQFDNLVPESKFVVSQESLTVGRSKAKAELYILKRKNCVMLIDLARNGKIQLSQQNCENPKALLSVAEELDIPRLNRKLNS